MTARSTWIAAVLAGTSLLLSTPAGAADAAQQRGQLPHGGSYVLSTDPTIGAAAVDLWFRAPGDGYGNDAPGISRLAATAAAVTRLESGRSLLELVRSVGGNFAIDVYPDIVGVTAIVPASAANRVVAAMTAAYFAPAIDDTALRTAQKDSAVLSVQQRYSSEQVLHNALFSQIFSGGPAHVAPLPDAISDITHPTLADVQAFAKRAFSSSNATLSIAGGVDASSLDAVTAGAPVAAPSPPIDSPLANPPAAATSVEAKVPGLGLAWVGPPIRDEKAATALDFIADYLFRDGTGVVARAVDASSDTYVSGQFITLHDPGVMLVTIDGSKTDGAKDTTLTALAKLAQPLDAATFEAARNAFIYHVAVDTQTPGGESDNLGWYAAEGNEAYAPGDAGGSYIQHARALDPAYVASIVRQYLAHPVVVQLSPAAKESSS